MNKFCVALLISSAQAVSLESIPAGSLMQNNPSHWRKVWPEGITDNADGDAEVLETFLKPEDEKEKKKAKKETYDYTLDEDVIATDKSIATAEGITGAKLTAPATKNGGLDMINVYDNTKRVFESGLPYAATAMDPRFGQNLKAVAIAAAPIV